MTRTITVKASGKGLHAITREVERVVDESGLREGLCTLFVRHTSASLIIQENADPKVLDDLETWMNRQVPEGPSLYTHDDEGPDDMPSHIRSILTQTSLSIPIMEGKLALGTWQGIYLWEHRHHARARMIVIHLGA